MSSEYRTILLCNFISGTGHHDSWTAMFAAALMERGFRVICATPNTEVVSEMFAMQGMAERERLHLLRLSSHLYDKAPPSSRLQNSKYSTLRQWLRRALEEQPRKELEGGRWVISAIKRAQYLATAPLLRLVRKLDDIRLRIFGYENTGTLSPEFLLTTVEHAISLAPGRPDFMFVMSVDPLMTDPSRWQTGLGSPIPWAGLRIAPFRKALAGREGYFSCPEFRGLCFLDEKAVDNYRHQVPNLEFEFLPDVADARLPVSEPSIVKEIVSQAKGRKIVLMCGSIEGRKNIAMFCQAAASAETEAFLFAIVGQLHESALSEEDGQYLSVFRRQAKGNTFFRDIYFKDEREMNALINSSDVIFAVYREFNLSSNMIGKAAVFRKRLLVARDSLMGDRVERFGLGMTVAQSDAVACVDALRKLGKGSTSGQGCAKYLEQYGASSLGSRLNGYIERCLGKTNVRANFGVAANRDD